MHDTNPTQDLIAELAHLQEDRRREARRRRAAAPWDDEALARVRYVMRLLACRLLALAFEQLQGAVRGGKACCAVEILRPAIEAGYWLRSDDLGHPFGYLNCCAVLDLCPAKGRAWARPYLEAIDAERERQRARQAAFAAAGAGPAAPDFSFSTASNNCDFCAMAGEPGQEQPAAGAA